MMMDTLQGRKLAMPFVPSYSALRYLLQGKQLLRKLWVRSLFSQSNSWVRIEGSYGVYRMLLLYTFPPTNEVWEGFI